jgi:hypothetical protein
MKRSSKADLTAYREAPRLRAGALWELDQIVTRKGGFVAGEDEVVLDCQEHALRAEKYLCKGRTVTSNS